MTGTTRMQFNQHYLLNAAVGTGKRHRGIWLFQVVEQKAVESSRG